MLLLGSGCIVYVCVCVLFLCLFVNSSCSRRWEICSFLGFVLEDSFVLYKVEYTQESLWFTRRRINHSALWQG